MGAIFPGLAVADDALTRGGFDFDVESGFYAQHREGRGQRLTKNGPGGRSDGWSAPLVV